MLHIQLNIEDKQAYYVQDRGVYNLAHQTVINNVEPFDSRDNNKKWTWAEENLVAKYLQTGDKGFHNLNAQVKRSWDNVYNKLLFTDLAEDLMRKEWDFVINTYTDEIYEYAAKTYKDIEPASNWLASIYQDVDMNKLKDLMEPVIIVPVNKWYDYVESTKPKCVEFEKWSVFFDRSKKVYRVIDHSVTAIIGVNYTTKTHAVELCTKLNKGKIVIEEVSKEKQKNEEDLNDTFICIFGVNC